MKSATFRAPLLAIALTFCLQTPASAQQMLNSLLEQARTDLRETEAAFKVVMDSNNGKPFDACKAEYLDFVATYHQWFIDHFKEYQLRDEALSSAYAGVQAKIDSLKSVQMIEVPGQVEKKEVSLRLVTEFLAELNRRLVSVPEEQIPLVIAQMEKPRFNQTGATFEQIKAAVQIMATNLNAQLKETQATYTIEFRQLPRAYDLDFVMKLGSGVGPKEYRFSLLGDGKTTTGLDEVSRLQMITTDGTKIGGYSANGTERFFEMYRKIVSPTCHEDKFLYGDFELPATAKASPWLKDEAIVAAIPNGISSETSNKMVMRKYAVVYLGNETTAANITVQGQSLTCTMFPGKVIEAQGKLYIFTVGSDYRIWVHEFRGAGWKSISGIDNSYRVLRAFVKDGVAHVEVKTSKGNIILSAADPTKQ